MSLAKGRLKKRSARCVNLAVLLLILPLLMIIVKSVQLLHFVCFDCFLSHLFGADLTDSEEGSRQTDDGLQTVKSIALCFVL